MTYTIGLASPIPQPEVQIPQSTNRNGGLWGGEVEPSTIDNPELRATFMAAHRAWAVKYAPHLLEEWLA